MYDDGPGSSCPSCREFSNSTMSENNVGEEAWIMKSDMDNFWNHTLVNLPNIQENTKWEI